MGVGFSDNCVLNLKGHNLEFGFEALDGLKVSEETKQIEATHVKVASDFLRFQ